MTSWRDEALCLGEDPSLFFPETGHSADTVPAAKAICNECPVIDECRDFALAMPQDGYGIFGGLTYSDRRKLRRRPPGRPRLDPINRTCRNCGDQYLGHNSSLYCPPCKPVVKARKQREQKRRAYHRLEEAS